MSSQRCPTRVFVGGLDVSVTVSELEEAFLNVGVLLRSLEIIMSRATGCSRGFALGTLRASMVSDEELLRQMRAAVVHGRAVTVLAVPASPNYHPAP